MNQKTDRHTYNEWWYSRSPLQIFREKETNKYDPKTYIDIQWVIIYPKTGTDIQRAIERETHTQREIRIERRMYTRKIKKENINILQRCYTLGELIPHFSHQYMQLTDNIPGHWDRYREKERQTRIERRTYTRSISCNIAEQWEKYSDKQKETQTKRRTYTPTVSDKIAWHCYTHLQTKREKEIRIKWRTHTRTITENIRRHWDRQREKETATWMNTRTYSRTISDNIAEHW